MKTYKKTKIFLILLTLIIIFRKDILISYPKIFIINNATKNADAILILSGNIEIRVEGAIKLYNEGYANKIFITSIKNFSNKYPHILKTRNELIKEIIEYENIKINYIPSIKDGATSTIDEAIDMAMYLKKYPIKRIILVSDDFHSQRALYIFNKIFKKYNIQTKVEIKAIYDMGVLENWYKKETSLLNFLILEPIKFLFYFFITENLSFIENT
jgi:uncharacterized SAM-binding protein YcdF (DUF218 family)